jgi:hypothetical protein
MISAPKYLLTAVREEGESDHDAPRVVRDGPEFVEELVHPEPPVGSEPSEVGELHHESPVRELPQLIVHTSSLGQHDEQIATRSVDDIQP